MARELSPNRWNWSQEHEKWVYIEIDQEGKKKFYFQIDPPQEFNELTMQIGILNEKLILCKNSKENEDIFNQMMRISKRMQCMGKNE